MKMNTFLCEKHPFLVGLIFLLIFNLIYIILGQDTCFQFGYDNLDSNVIWNKIIAESHALFSSNNVVIPPAMGGLPRLSYPSEFVLDTWLYFFFSPFAAYVINIYLISIVAYVGMFTYLKHTATKGNILIMSLVSLLFSMLPYWPHAGISVAGIPLVMYAFSVVKEKKTLAYVLLLFYVFYSSFVLVGMFLIAIMGLVVFWGWFNNKHLVLDRLYFVIIALVLYFLQNYRLIESVLFSDYISHRSDFNIELYSIKDTLIFLFKLLFGEWGHNLVIKAPIVISVIVLLVYRIVIKRGFDNEKELIRVASFIFFISIVSVLFQNIHFNNFYVSVVPFLKQIQLQRFYWLLPPVFYLLLFYVYDEIVRHAYGKYMVLVLFVIHFGFLLERNRTFKQLVLVKVLQKESTAISYAEFYSEELYSAIDQYIGRDKSEYRVASIGLQPAAALYSGFYTVDGYYPNYPKAYKDKVFDVIRLELNKDSGLKRFFSDFGSVCIIPSAELIQQKYKDKGYIVPTIYKSTDSYNPIENLDIDFKKLRQVLHCQYIFSALPINDPDRYNLIFHRSFENASSPYRIFLYELGADH